MVIAVFHIDLGSERRLRGPVNYPNRTRPLAWWWHCSILPTVLLRRESLFGIEKRVRVDEVTPSTISIISWNNIRDAIKDAKIRKIKSSTLDNNYQLYQKRTFWFSQRPFGQQAVAGWSAVVFVWSMHFTKLSIMLRMLLFGFTLGH